MAKRGISITLGTIVLIGVVGYGPATLLGPLPAPAVATLALPTPAAAVTPPALPTTGATAVAQTAAVLAHAGDTAALPISGAARLITALVVAQRYPLPEGPGQDITMTEQNYETYRERVDAGQSAVSLFPGDVWTQHSVLQAMLRGGSTAHADALATWAYGSIDGYLKAAQAWAKKEGLTSLVVTDAAGVDTGTQATASDLARITALAAADPGITAAFTEEPDTLAVQRGLTLPSPYLADTGIRVLYRGYTDQAGIILLFSQTVTTPAGPFSYASASLRSATWQTLETETRALVASAESGINSTADLATGTPLLTITTDWEQSVRGLSGETPAQPHWGSTAPTLRVEPGTITVPLAEGTPVGSVTITDDSQATGDRRIPLIADGALTEPDVLWRLTHPLPLLKALWEQLIP
ncbi:hypothetical protein [Mycetocola tolaasinivorans]|nr:hypothetical protein [Mycetocola tolaasinivorans]